MFLWNTARTTHPGNGLFLPDRNGYVYHSIETLELTIIGTCRCNATSATHRIIYFLCQWKWAGRTLKESLSCLVSSTKPDVHKGEGLLERQEKERSFVEWKYVRIAMSVSRPETDRKRQPAWTELLCDTTYNSLDGA